MAGWSKNQWAEAWKAQRLEREAMEGTPSQAFTRQAVAERIGAVAQAARSYADWWKRGPLGGAIAETPPEKREAWNVPELFFGFAGPGAIKSAGLPMDIASRMARANEQGYTTLAFHGTPKGGFSNFSPETIGSSTDPGYLGKGFYFTDQPNIANAYSRGYTEGTNSAVYPVMLKMDNPFYWGDKTLGNKEIADLMNKEGLTLHQAIERKLKSGNHDAIIASYPGGGQEYVIFSPSQIRSKFAAFNPNSMRDPDMLAGSAIIPLSREQRKARR